MQERAGTFKGVGGLQLAFRAWLPDQAPQALLVLVHGSGVHCGRYGHLVAPLTAAGHAVLGFDLRGHGLSAGPRGHIDSWDDYRGDLARFLDLAHEMLPELPVFLYGHSLGSLVVPDYLLHWPDSLAGAILSGTALEPTEAAPPLLTLVARVMSGIYPRLTMNAPL